jgi:hypothetical protein
VSSGTYGVAGIDMNMTYYMYNEILSSFPSYDHYYILDLDYEVINHSKLPNLNKLYSIVNIEFGMDANGNIEDDMVNTTESIYFTDKILPLFTLNETNIVNYTVSKVEYLLVISPIVFKLKDGNEEMTH